MIVNLNPSVNFFDENVNVLKFSSIANQIQIGINDDEKIHYKIEPEKVEQNNRLTVAWERDQNKTNHVSDSEDEEDNSGEESEETETEVEETFQETEEESDDSEEVSDNSEESSEDDEEEEETEDETEVEENVTKSRLQKTVSTVNETTDDEENPEESEEDEEEETMQESEDETEIEETQIEETEMTVEMSKNRLDNTTDITVNHSIVKKAESTRINPKTPKSVLKKCDKSSVQIKINDSDLSTLLNETSMAIVKNTADMSKIQKLSTTELCQIIENLKSHIIKTKREATKFEAELRNQLVTKWSKKVEDTETYFQKEMENYKLRLDSDLAERIDFIEQVNERKNKVKIEEIKKNCETKLAENEKEIKQLKSEIDRLKEDLASRVSPSRKNDRSIKRKLSHSGYDESNINEDVNMMEYDDDLQIKPNNTSVLKNNQINQSMQIQTSLLFAGVNTSIQTETIIKKSIGIDVSFLLFIY